MEMISKAALKSILNSRVEVNPIHIQWGYVFKSSAGGSRGKQIQQQIGEVCAACNYFCWSAIIGHEFLDQDITM